MEQYAGDNQYSCALCDQEHISRNYIKRNMMIHTKENSYKCAMCGKGFISRNHLKRHMKGHAMNNPYPCAQCVEKFINQQKRHINSHTGKFHSIVLFIIQERGWIIFLVQLLPKIFSFASVISRQKTS